MKSQTIADHIVETPGTCGGRPRIAGRRITIEDIAIWHERMGLSVDEIAKEYDLSLAQVHAALTYYFDHKASVDERIREGEVFAEKMRAETPSLLQTKLSRRMRR